MNVSSPRYNRTPIRRDVFFSSCPPVFFAYSQALPPRSAVAAMARIRTFPFSYLPPPYSIGYSIFSKIPLLKISPSIYSGVNVIRFSFHSPPAA